MAAHGIEPGLAHRPVLHADGRIGLELRPPGSNRLQPTGHRLRGRRAVGHRSLQLVHDRIDGEAARHERGGAQAEPGEGRRRLVKVAAIVVANRVRPPASSPPPMTSARRNPGHYNTLSWLSWL